MGSFLLAIVRYLDSEWGQYRKLRLKLARGRAGQFSDYNVSSGTIVTVGELQVQKCRRLAEKHQ